MKQEYAQHFTSSERNILENGGIFPSLANGYHEGLGVFDIIALRKNKIFPDLANAYFDALKDTNLDEHYKDVTSEFLRKGHIKEKSFFDKVKLKIKKLYRYLKKDETSRLNSYINSLDDKSIVEWIGIFERHKQANSHSSLGYLITNLHNSGISPSYINNHDKVKNVFRLFDTPYFIDSSKLEVVSTGFQGVVIKNKSLNEILKFGANIKHEQYLFSLFNQRSDNIVNPIKNQKALDKEGYISSFFAPYLRLEYIKGETLENKLTSVKLNIDQIVKYSNGLLNGLSELRSAGIYHHRDLRPGNIIIDSDRDEPVIIDLGIATTDKNALPKDNRRYGGPNDLTSLGQIVYKMATGEHLFSESKSMEKTVYADNIKDARDKIYEDKSGKTLENYLEKIDSNIKDKTINGLVKDCLTANIDDLHTIQGRYS